MDVSTKSTITTSPAPSTTPFIATIHLPDGVDALDEKKALMVDILANVTDNQIMNDNDSVSQTYQTDVIENRSKRMVGDDDQEVQSKVQDLTIGDSMTQENNNKQSENDDEEVDETQGNNNERSGNDDQEVGESLTQDNNNKYSIPDAKDVGEPLMPKRSGNDAEEVDETKENTDKQSRNDNDEVVHGKVHHLIDGDPLTQENINKQSSDKYVPIPAQLGDSQPLTDQISGTLDKERLPDVDPNDAKDRYDDDYSVIEAPPDSPKRSDINVVALEDFENTIKKRDSSTYYRSPFSSSESDSRNTHDVEGQTLSQFIPLERNTRIGVKQFVGRSGEGSGADKHSRVQKGMIRPSSGMPKSVDKTKEGNDGDHVSKADQSQQSNSKGSLEPAMEKKKDAQNSIDHEHRTATRQDDGNVPEVVIRVDRNDEGTHSSEQAIDQRDTDKEEVNQGNRQPRQQRDMKKDFSSKDGHQRPARDDEVVHQTYGQRSVMDMGTPEHPLEVEGSLQPSMGDDIYGTLIRTPKRTNQAGATMYVDPLTGDAKPLKNDGGVVDAVLTGDAKPLKNDGGVVDAVLTGDAKPLKNDGGVVHAVLTGDAIPLKNDRGVVDAVLTSDAKPLKNDGGVVDAVLTSDARPRLTAEDNQDYVDQVKDNLQRKVGGKIQLKKSDDNDDDDDLTDALLSMRKLGQLGRSVNNTNGSNVVLMIPGQQPNNAMESRPASSDQTHSGKSAPNEPEKMPTYMETKKMKMGKDRQEAAGPEDQAAEEVLKEEINPDASKSKSAAAKSKGEDEQIIKLFLKEAREYQNSPAGMKSNSMLKGSDTGSGTSGSEPQGIMGDIEQAPQSPLEGDPALQNAESIKKRVQFSVADAPEEPSNNGLQHLRELIRPKAENTNLFDKNYGSGSNNGVGWRKMLTGIQAWQKAYENYKIRGLEDPNRQVPDVLESENENRILADKELLFKGVGSDAQENVPNAAQIDRQAAFNVALDDPSYNPLTFHDSEMKIRPEDSAQSTGLTRDNSAMNDGVSSESTGLNEGVSSEGTGLNDGVSSEGTMLNDGVSGQGIGEDGDGDGEQLLDANNGAYIGIDEQQGDDEERSDSTFRTKNAFAKSAIAREMEEESRSQRESAKEGTKTANKKSEEMVYDDNLKQVVPADLRRKKQRVNIPRVGANDANTDEFTRQKLQHHAIQAGGGLIVGDSDHVANIGQSLLDNYVEQQLHAETGNVQQPSDKSLATDNDAIASEVISQETSVKLRQIVAAANKLSESEMMNEATENKDAEMVKNSDGEAITGEDKGNSEVDSNGKKASEGVTSNEDKTDKRNEEAASNGDKKDDKEMVVNSSDGKTDDKDTVATSSDDKADNKDKVATSSGDKVDNAGRMAASDVDKSDDKAKVLTSSDDTTDNKDRETTSSEDRTDNKDKVVTTSDEKSDKKITTSDEKTNDEVVASSNVKQEVKEKRTTADDDNAEDDDEQSPRKVHHRKKNKLRKGKHRTKQSNKRKLLKTRHKKKGKANKRRVGFPGVAFEHDFRGKNSVVRKGHHLAIVDASQQYRDRRSPAIDVPHQTKRICRRRCHTAHCRREKRLRCIYVSSSYDMKSTDTNKPLAREKRDESELKRADRSPKTPVLRDKPTQICSKNCKTAECMRKKKRQCAKILRPSPSHLKSGRPVNMKNRLIQRKKYAPRDEDRLEKLLMIDHSDDSLLKKKRDSERIADFDTGAFSSAVEYLKTISEKQRLKRHPEDEDVATGLSYLATGKTQTLPEIHKDRRRSVYQSHVQMTPLSSGDIAEAEENRKAMKKTKRTPGWYQPSVFEDVRRKTDLRIGVHHQRHDQDPEKVILPVMNEDYRESHGAIGIVKTEDEPGPLHALPHDVIDDVMTASGVKIGTIGKVSEQRAPKRVSIFQDPPSHRLRKTYKVSLAENEGIEMPQKRRQRRKSNSHSFWALRPIFTTSMKGRHHDQIQVKRVRRSNPDDPPSDVISKKLARSLRTGFLPSASQLLKARRQHKTRIHYRYPDRSRQADHALQASSDQSQDSDGGGTSPLSEERRDVHVYLKSDNKYRGKKVSIDDAEMRRIKDPGIMKEVARRSSNAGTDVDKKVELKEKLIDNEINIAKQYKTKPLDAEKERIKMKVDDVIAKAVVPERGSWTDWGPWSPCNRCLGRINSTRTRICLNIAGQSVKDKCTGPTGESKECKIPRKCVSIHKHAHDENTVSAPDPEAEQAYSESHMTQEVVGIIALCVICVVLGILLIMRFANFATL